MKRVTELALFTLIILNLSGCAFGPLYSHETAQTVGAHKVEMTGIYGNAGITGKATWGLLDNLDLGLHWETLSIGLMLKYAFINNHVKGMSASGTLGIGESFGGNYFSVAGSVSYLTEVFEPYFTLRGVYVYYNSANTHFTLNGSSLDLPKFTYSYSYLEPIVGTRVWITPNHFFLSAEVGTIVVNGGGFVIASGGLGYRF